MVIHHHDLASCNEFFIGIEGCGVLGRGVEFDHGPAAHLEEMTDGHRRRAKYDGEFHIYRGSGWLQRTQRWLRIGDTSFV